MRILTADDLLRALPMSLAIEAMAEAFTALSQGEVEAPLRLGLNTPGGVTLAMPAYADGVTALKVVSIYGNNPSRGLPALHAVVLVLDGETGRPLALLDGTSLTALRTGAATGLATRHLARYDASILAVIGAGGMAPAQIEAVCAVRQIREIRIYSPRRAARLAERMRVETSAEVRLASSAHEALSGAHIIVACTDSATPVVLPEDVSPGAHINGVGSYTPDMAEIAPELAARAKVVVDQREAAWAEAGELIQARDAGLIDDVYAEIGEIASRAKPGRETAEEITFFKSVGVAAQDLYAARAALARAESLGLGTAIDL